MIPGETVHSPLPQDLPWWNPDHAVFFGVLYAVILVIGSGLAVTFLKSLSDTWQEKKKDT
ncbi:MAG: hypothetical protein ACQES5_04865 [Thermodesulfobacteriota bacterium]